MRLFSMFLREKSSAVSRSKFGFIPKSAMRKTVSLSHIEDKEIK